MIRDGKFYFQMVVSSLKQLKKLQHLSTLWCWFLTHLRFPSSLATTWHSVKRHVIALSSWRCVERDAQNWLESSIIAHSPTHDENIICEWLSIGIKWHRTLSLFQQKSKLSEVVTVDEIEVVKKFQYHINGKFERPFFSTRQIF